MLYSVFMNLSAFVASVGLWIGLVVLVLLVVFWILPKLSGQEKRLEDYGSKQVDEARKARLSSAERFWFDAKKQSDDFDRRLRDK